MVSCEPVHVSVKVKGHTRLPADQLVGCPGDEASQCKIVAMYWLQWT